MFLQKNISLFKKYPAIHEPEERHGVDLGLTYKNREPTTAIAWQAFIMSPFQYANWWLYRLGQSWELALLCMWGHPSTNEDLCQVFCVLESKKGWCWWVIRMHVYSNEINGCWKHFWVFTSFLWLLAMVLMVQLSQNECEANYKQAYLGCIGLGDTGISLNLPAKTLLPVLFSDASMKCC